MGGDISEEVDNYFWHTEAKDCFFENDNYLRLLITKLESLGFKVDYCNKKNFCVTHYTSKIVIYLLHGSVPTVTCCLMKGHSDIPIIKKYKGKGDWVLGRFMTRGSTTESNLDFRTLDTLYTRILDTLETYSSK